MICSYGKIAIADCVYLLELSLAKYSPIDSKTDRRVLSDKIRLAQASLVTSLANLICLRSGYTRSHEAAAASTVFVGPPVAAVEPV